jgi:hypothetical protein
VLPAAFFLRWQRCLPQDYKSCAKKNHERN